MDVSFHYTPKSLAKELVSSVNIEPTDRLLEPFAGGDAFYDAFPVENPKDWCEITRGKDFFTYDKKCDIIITNPPFFSMDGNRTPMLFDCLWKCIQVAEKKVCFLIATRCLIAFTPKRLDRIAQEGWSIAHIKVVNIKEWVGRYYFVTFEKNTPGFVSFLRKTYTLAENISL